MGALRLTKLVGGSERVGMWMKKKFVESKKGERGTEKKKRRVGR